MVKNVSFFKRVVYAAPLFFLMAVVSCSKKDNKGSVTPTPVAANYGKLQVGFSNNVNGQPVTLGSVTYKNAAGNQYKVDLLMYYVSNFTLVKNDGSEKNFKNYHLVNVADSTTYKFTLDSVENGEYVSVKFYLGVDTSRNHDGTQYADLDPVHGMTWTWNTGYIFFKHEGSFVNSFGGKQDLLFHYGSDKALSTVVLPITQLTVKSDAHIMSLNFDLNKLYSEKNVIDFDVYNYQQSSTAADSAWIEKLKSNFPNAFTIDKVQ